jgi:hypothetical protein
MTGFVVLAAASALTLPGYALGQPMDEAHFVVPEGRSRDAWHLRCAGDALAPPGLIVSTAERQAGVQRCWTTETVDGVERPVASPFRHDGALLQEIEFLRGRIVRIIRYRTISGHRETISSLSLPDAAKIDRLSRDERANP